MGWVVVCSQQKTEKQIFFHHDKDASNLTYQQFAQACADVIQRVMDLLGVEFWFVRYKFLSLLFTFFHISDDYAYAIYSIHSTGSSFPCTGWP